MMTAKRKRKQIFCILNWGMAASCSRNMNFVKCRVSDTSEDKFFNVFFLHVFLRMFAFGPFLLIRLSRQNTSPLYHYFSCSDPHPLTQQYVFLALPLKVPPHLLLNDWSYRSCSFLNILLFLDTSSMLPS